MYQQLLGSCDRLRGRIGLPTIPNAQPVTGCGSERYSVDQFVLRVSDRFRWVLWPA
jgi:hypothetical protein